MARSTYREIKLGDRSIGGDHSAEQTGSFVAEIVVLFSGSREQRQMLDDDGSYMVASVSTPRLRSWITLLVRRRSQMAGAAAGPMLLICRTAARS